MGDPKSHRFYEPPSDCDSDLDSHHPVPAADSPLAAHCLYDEAAARKAGLRELEEPRPWWEAVDPHAGRQLPVTAPPHVQQLRQKSTPAPRPTTQSRTRTTSVRMTVRADYEEWCKESIGRGPQESVEAEFAKMLGIDPRRVRLK